MKGVTKFTQAAVLALGTLLALEAARLLGASLPPGGLIAAAAVSGVLAATAAVRNVAFLRRGPVILAFPRRDAMLCDVAQAAVVRSAAQLRGSLGGAGWVHPRRLAFPAVAWGAAAALSLALALDGRGAAALAALGVLVAGGLAAFMPARAFYYREAPGGCVLVFPPAGCQRLLEEAGLEPALSPFEPGTLLRPSDAEWVNSRSEAGLAPIDAAEELGHEG